MHKRMLVVTLLVLCSGLLFTGASYFVKSQVGIDCYAYNGNPDFLQETLKQWETNGTVPRPGENPNHGYPFVYTTDVSCVQKSSLGYEFNLTDADGNPAAFSRFSMQGFVADAAIWAVASAGLQKHT